MRDRLIEWKVSFSHCMEVGYIFIEAVRERSFDKNQDPMLFLHDLFVVKKKHAFLVEFLHKKHPLVMDEFDVLYVENQREIAEMRRKEDDDSVVCEKDYQT
jgi:hypothetical protein